MLKTAVVAAPAVASLLMPAMARQRAYTGYHVLQMALNLAVTNTNLQN
jgi:hypothetical protein